MIGRRWMQSPRRSLTRFPSALSGKGRKGGGRGRGDSRSYTAMQPRVSVSWLWMAQPAPKCRTGRRDETRPDARPGPWHHRARVLPGAPPAPGHFSPFFYHRPPPFVLLIEFFSFASRRRPRIALRAEIEGRIRRGGTAGAPRRKETGQ